MKNSHSGFSLVELMISIVLGLILMTGVVKMFLGSKVAFSSQQAVSRIQETGRLAIEFMSRDIRMAGYMGCLSRLAVPVSTVSNPANFPNDMTTAIRGYTAEPSLSNLVPDPAVGSDLLQVTRAEGISAIVSVDTTKKFVTVRRTTTEANACANGSTRFSGLCLNDNVIVTNCQTARIFNVTNLAPSATDIVLSHALPANTVNDWQTGASITDPVYAPGAEVLPMLKTVYFIVLKADGVPSLFQNTNGVNTELLEGVEDMRLTYGRDTNADGVPDNYGTAAQVDAAAAAGAAWATVLSVRIEILVRSIEDNVVPERQVYSFGGNQKVQAVDNRMRQVFTSTVAIRSRIQ